MKTKKEIEKLYSWFLFFNDSNMTNQTYRKGVIDALDYVLCNSEKFDRYMQTMQLK